MASDALANADYGAPRTTGVDQLRNIRQEQTVRCVLMVNYLVIALVHYPLERK